MRAGRLSAALSNVVRVLAARPGIEIRRGVEAARIEVRDERVTGVSLAGGEEIPAALVLSGADPRRTLLGLVEPGWLAPEFVRTLRGMRSRGVVAQVTLTLEHAPGFSTLAIAPSLDYLERAHDDAKYGRVSQAPYIEARAEELSVHAHVQFAPYALAGATWDDAQRAALADLVVRTLGEHAPGFSRARDCAKRPRAARSGKSIRLARRSDAPRRTRARPVVVDASHPGPCTLSHADRRPVSLRIGNASGRLDVGRVRLPRCKASAEGPPEMKRLAFPAAWVIAFAVLAGSSVADGEKQHRHSRIDASKAQDKAFGRAFDPRKAQRTIRIEMSDTMRFTPAELEVRQNETVRFVVRLAEWLTTVFVLGGVFVLLFGLERWIPLRKPRHGLARRLRANLAISALALLTATLLVDPAGIRALEFASDHGIGLLRWAGLPAAAEFMLGFALLDLTFYYWHLANHKVGFLWRFHNVHHIDPDLDVSTSFRFHFAEVAMSAGFRIVQIAALGVFARYFRHLRAGVSDRYALPP
jgi:hypothetical protein